MVERTYGQGTLTPAQYQDELRGKQSINNQIRTATVTSQFDIAPREVSRWRDIVIGDGTITNQTFYELNTSTSSTSRQRLETAQIGDYLGGSISTASVFAQKDSVPNGYVDVGYGRDGGDNAMFLRWENDDSYSVIIRRGGVETVIPQSDWRQDQARSIDVYNENDDFVGELWGFDTADGTRSGPSGITCDMRRGQQYQFSISWGGPMLFSIDAVDRQGHDHSTPVFLFDPQDGEPVLKQPNHPVFGEIQNDGSTQQDTLKIGSRQFVQYGESGVVNRDTENLNDDVTVPTDSYTPIMAFRRKTPDYEGITLRASSLSIQTNNTLHVYVAKDPTFNTAGTWTEPTNVLADETAIEVQNDPDVLVDGDKWDGFISGSGKNTQAISSTEGKEMPVPRNQPIVLYARSISGNTATANFSMTVEELW